MLKPIQERYLVFYLGGRRLVLLAGEVQKGGVRVLASTADETGEGFRNGFVTHVDKAAKRLSAAMERLKKSRDGEFLRDLEDLDVYVVLGNTKLASHTFTSSVYFSGGRKTLSATDVRQVMDQTRSVATLPLSEAILQCLPASFLVDDLDQVQDPSGLEAERLGVTLKIFTMENREFKNIVKAFEAAEIEVQGFFPRTLAVSEAVLSEREKQEGTLLLDTGTDGVYLSLWRGGMVASTRILELGIRRLCQEISSAWQISAQDAERVFDRYGSLSTQPQFGDELIPLVVRDSQEKKQIERRNFHEHFLKTAKDWVAQILSEADSFIREHGVFHPHYVFAGSGSYLDGFLEFLHREFATYARLGLVRSIDAAPEKKTNPAFAAALGGLQLVAHLQTQKRLYEAPKGLLEKTLVTAKDWLASYF